MTKLIKWCSIVLLFPVLLFLVVAGNTLLNNYHLWKFEKQLYSFPLPSASKILEKGSEIGVLTGNGNHCDFVAYLDIKTTKSVVDIENHYKKMEIFPALSYKAQQGIIVESRSQGIIKIKIWDAPNSSNFDLRCT